MPPSKNCTVPVADEGDTVAVNVTFWPEVDGFRLEAIVVVVAALLTIFVKAAEILPAKVESPL